ncbi:hypothetical protein [Metallibacterium scheffleri]|jgi:hypothetical protein|nr:hypothetical protein [Metallibacterium scheffleri]
MRLMRALMLTLALLPLSALALQAPPNVHCTSAPVPPGSSLSLVASQIAINGLPMAIVAAHSTLPPQAFLQFYATAWTAPDGHPVYIRYPLGPWQVIAHAEGGCFYTVQVQAAGTGSGALIGVSMPKRGSNNAMVLDVAAPGDARVLTHMVSEDGDKQGNTWLLYTANPTAAVMRFYARTLKQQGWARIMQRQSPGKPGVATAMYQKGVSNMGLVVQPMRAGSSITLTVESH